MFVKLKAFAKLNLILQVFYKRDDGYHEIDSIMQSISLFDEITIEKIKNNVIILELNCDFLPNDHKNLAYKAADLFFKRANMPSGVKIFIDKKIPVGAGLAGGSSDAAAVLIGLNKLFDANLSESDLLLLGAKVGSDVPFCIIGGLCRCQGRGEIVAPVIGLDIKTKRFILVKPAFSISTKWVYENFNEKFIVSYKIVDRQLRDNKLSFHNDLEKVVFREYPEILKIKENLSHFGCSQTLMSGSGSCVFGVVDNDIKAYEVYIKTKQIYDQVYVVNPVEHGIVFG